MSVLKQNIAANTTVTNKGLFYALGIIVAWLAFLIFALTRATSLTNPINLLYILILTHLYTGLFITAHDSIHGVICKNRLINNLIGGACLFLFAALSYSKSTREHHNHHKYVATEKDPDFHHGNFFAWYLRFMYKYITVIQFLILAVSFNLIQYFFGISKQNLVLFWIIPPILSSLQLFYFGTYLPHKNPEEIDNSQKSRTQEKNHVWGFISCYFFGYHFEHHAKPFLPWWRLWQEK